MEAEVKAVETEPLVREREHHWGVASPTLIIGIVLDSINVTRLSGNARITASAER